MMVAQNNTSYMIGGKDDHDDGDIGAREAFYFL